MTEPAGFTNHTHGDLPPAYVRIGSDGVEVVLTDSPRVAWTVQCADVNGTPRVVRLAMRVVSVGTEQEPTYLDAEVTRPPFGLLARIWARVMTEGTSPASVATEPQPVHLPRRPDPRPYGGHTDEYRAALREWSEPIAQTVMDARASGRAIYPEVARVFGVSESRAEQMVAIAREAGHNLPKRTQTTGSSSNNTDK